MISVIVYVNVYRKNAQCREICRFVLFADDTNVFLTAPDNNLLFIKAQHILQKLRTYLDANYLHIHLKKPNSYILKLLAPTKFLMNCFIMITKLNM